MRFLFLMLIPAAVLAQAPLITDRPDQTESAVTVPVAMLQIEVGGLTERSGNVDAVSLGTTLLRYGLHPRFEVRLGIPGWQRVTPVDGIGDLETGVKVRLAPADATFDLAVLAGATLPTGAAAFTTDQVDPRARLAFAMPVTERLGVGINVGAAGTAGRADALYTAVLGFSLSERVGVFAESFGTLPVSDGGVAEHLMDTGVTVLLSPVLQFDASGGVGINANAVDWFVGAGVSVRVGR